MVNKNKVTLLWALYTSLTGHANLPSLSLACLAKALEREGIDVSCIDSSLLVYDKWKYEKVNAQNKDEILNSLIKEVENTRPEILGIGFWTEGISFVKIFVALIKKRNPNLIIVLGGPTASFLPDKVFSFVPEADYIVRGEGEESLLELAKNIFAKRNAQNVLGLSYKNKKVNVHNKDRPLIKNLNKLPLIDFENFTYIGHPRGMNILTSRGCPFRCSYCADSNYYGSHRLYSPEYISKQVKKLTSLYNLEYIVLTDDNVVISPQRATALFGRLAKDKLGCKFPIGVRSDCLNETVFKALKKAGVPSMTVGVESIVPRILKYYNRTNNVDNYIQNITCIIRLLKKYKMDAAFSFVLGAPIETKKEIVKNLRFMKKLSDNNFLIYAGILHLVPGSPMWERYQNGHVKVAAYSSSRKDARFYFDQEYFDQPWICPENFYFVHEKYSKKEFGVIVRNVRRIVGKLKTTPADLENVNE